MRRGPTLGRVACQRRIWPTYGFQHGESESDVTNKRLFVETYQPLMFVLAKRWPML